MRILTKFIIVTAIITVGCTGGPASADEAQSDPTALVKTIFYLIENEKYDALPALIDEEANDDMKQLGALKDADEAEQKQTRQYFSTATLDDPVIDGDKASIKIKLAYGFEETFEMVKKNGKWYLLSY